MLRWAIATVAVMGMQAPLMAAEWGSVSGQVVLDGEVPKVPPLATNNVCDGKEVPNESLAFDPETKGVESVFVYLFKAPSDIHPDLKDSSEKEVLFDQKGCRFIPHAMVVRNDQTVLCKSNDSVAHNIHTNPFSNTPQNFIVQPNDRTGMPITMPSRESLPVKVQCDIHNYMVAWWLVVDHPYAAVTDAQGKFVIENLPAGEHEFRVWHEEAGYLDRKYKVKVEPGKTTELPPLKVSASKFKK